MTPELSVNEKLISELVFLWDFSRLFPPAIVQTNYGLIRAEFVLIHVSHVCDGMKEM